MVIAIVILIVGTVSLIGLAIEQYPPPAPRGDLHLDSDFSGFPQEAPPDDGFGPVAANHGAIWSPSERTKRRKVGNRLEHIRLAGTVVSHQYIHSWVGPKLEMFVRAKLPQFEPIEPHVSYNRTGIRR